MSATVSVDISEFQPPVDNTYSRDWLSFRACFGGYVDKHAAANLAWAVKARAAGRLKGFSVYVVYLPGLNTAILNALDTLGVPDDCVVMIDVETWRGQSYEIHGDHSTDINALASALRQRQGRDNLVWDYGNQGDLAEVHPHRPDWLGVVVASYGGTKPSVPNLVGWQYTDGQPQYDRSTLPHSTPPFGRCDHNVFYDPPEADMPLTDADVQKLVQAVKQAVIQPATTGQPAETIASDLRDVHDKVAALQKQVAALQAVVSTIKTGSVDVPALATQLAAHLGIQVVAK